MVTEDKEGGNLGPMIKKLNKLVNKAHIQDSMCHLRSIAAANLEDQSHFRLVLVIIFVVCDYFT